MRPWTFVHVTDIHVGSPRSFRFTKAFNENWQTARKQILEIKPDLLLVGGDVARDGRLHKYELEAIKADFDSLLFPYYVIPGNMDTGDKHADVSGPIEGRDHIGLNLQSEHLHQWSSVFGPVWWSFVHKGVRFSGFCDMIAGSGLPEEQQFWKWMESQKEQPRADHHIWVMHYPLFIDDLHEPSFDIRDPKQYQDWYFGIDEPARSRLMHVFKATGTDIVIGGHVHCRKVHYAEDIRFDLAPSTAIAQYAKRWEDGDSTLGFLRYDVTEQGIEWSFVPLERVSRSKEGHGPGEFPYIGHPSADQADILHYSIADGHREARQSMLRGSAREA